MRKLAWAALVLVVGGWLAMKTSFASYAGTLWSQVKTDAKKQVPTRFEIERVRHELEQLDDDIGGMIRPIAEYKAAIARLQKDIARTPDGAGRAEADPLDDDQGPGGQSDRGTRTRARSTRPTASAHKLQRDFESYQRMEKNLASQRKLLEAKESRCEAAQDQLAKVIAKKREFELRLAQLEADEETLQIARIGSKLEIDDSRATQIEAALAEIEQRHDGAAYRDRAEDADVRQRRRSRWAAATRRRRRCGRDPRSTWKATRREAALRSSKMTLVSPLAACDSLEATSVASQWLSRCNRQVAHGTRPRR